MTSQNKQPLVIFELANNHMGDLQFAKKIISEYYNLSLNYRKYGIKFAFKFQFRDLDTFIHKDFKKSDHEGVKRFESTKLSDKQWDDLIKFTKKKFITVCTAFDEISVNKIIKYKFDFIKIASCSINDWPLVEYLQKKVKTKIIASLGGKNDKEIREIISFFKNKKKNIQYLYCVAKYPTKPENLNLEYFSKLRSLYGSEIAGFSTHENPEETLSGALSYAMGARIFEKHVNIKSRNYKINKYSTTPDQINSWLESLKKAIIRFGSSKKRSLFLKEEKNNLLQFQRGVYVKNKTHIKKGDTLNLDNIAFKYPSFKNQLVANDFSKFKTFVLKKNLIPDQQISYNDIVIKNLRSDIETIREKILELINISMIIVPKNSRLEISHHMGLKKFNKIGMSMITIYNGLYCKKYLFLLKGQNHPAQYHKIKTESFLILFGSVKLKLTKGKKVETKILKIGDLITIEPKTIHEFRSLGKEGSIIEELSTKHVKDDSYYLDKEIIKNKNRKSFISLY
jgi:sialic acid synthase SpsE/mannose-6-phosphate isomerase-like protein (cupin superfamily)